MDTSAAGILLSPVRMAPSSSFPLESPQHWSTPSSDSQERATQRFRSSTSRLFHTPKSPGQTLHDPSFHPGRRCCYQLGATNSAEAESARRQLADLFESWCFNSKDKFQVCLESCTHGRPAVSLRNGLDALKDCETHDLTEKAEKTQYQAYAHVLEQKVAKLNWMGSGSLGLSTSWMYGLVPQRHYGTLAQLLGESTEYASAKVPLEFCHNEAICMAPEGAKANRGGVGRKARIGSFEVLVAVYRFNEGHWYEFVLFSKLDSQRFPSLSTLESLLHSLVVRAAGVMMRVTLAAMSLQAYVRKKLVRARFRGLLFMVGCNTACGCLFVYVCLCLSWCICLSLCVCLCVMCDAAARHGVCGVHQIACG